MSKLLWIQSGGCGGCSQSLLLQPDLMPRLQRLGVEMVWHPACSVPSGPDFWAIVDGFLAGREPLDYLCIEGSVLTANGGAAHRLSGRPGMMSDLIGELSQVAGNLLAIGSCTAFGGMSAVGPNPAGAMGLQYDNKHLGGFLGAKYRSRSGRPVINLAGCAIHAGWFADCMSFLVNGELVLDEFNRLNFYTNHLVHHGCPRNEYYEYKSSAGEANCMGCLMENFGCKGTQARGDCNIRLWPGGGSCLRGGYSCIDCTAPGFQQPGHPFLETAKVAGLPSTLPTDMPKAWFVALSALSKAATPERVRTNANSPFIRVPPNQPKKPTK
ncbi:MAG: HupU protein [bacterium]|nr:HupU protein [bacterium]